MKEGKVWDEVHAFLLLYLSQLYRPFFLTLFFTHSGAGGPVSLKIWLKSSAPFEVSVRDTGSCHRKKRITLPNPIAYTICSTAPEVLCFILLHRLYSFHKQKPQENHHPTQLENKSTYFFFICLSDNKQERLHLLLWIVRTVSRH